MTKIIDTIDLVRLSKVVGLQLTINTKVCMTLHDSSACWEITLLLLQLVLV